MPNLNEGIIRSLPLRIPSIPEQRAIAHTLGTLDDKIELNRRMSETLEAMARALFRSWLVILQDDRFEFTASITVCPLTTSSADVPLVRRPSRRVNETG